MLLSLDVATNIPFMAEQDKINLFVTQLLQQLSDVYRECERRTTWTEAVCSDSSNLFKPWPKKEPREKVRDAVQTRQEADIDAAGGDSVPVEELAELRVLDRVLSKARKVRTKYHDKLKELQDADTPEGATEEDAQGHKPSESNALHKPAESVRTTEPSKTNKRLLKNKDMPAPSELPKKGVTGYSTGVKVMSKNAPSQKGESIGVVSQTTLNRLLQKPSLGSTHQKPSHTSAPPSRRFTPAHASAPYRTDPNHQHRSKVTRGGIRRQTHETASCQDRCTLRLGSNVAGSITDDMTESQRHHLTEEWLQQSVTSELPPVDGHCPQMTAECCHQTLVNTDNVTTGVENGGLGKFEGGAMEGGCRTSAPQAGGNGGDGREKLFLLQRDGHSVPLPRNLVRAATINWKLRHKVHRAAILSPMTCNKTQSAAAEFSLKLHNYVSLYAEKLKFCRMLKYPNMKNNNWTQCEEVSEDSLRLLQQLHALCDIYDDLSTALQQLSAPHLHEGSSWREVLRCQKTVEYVFTLFDDLEAGYNDIKAKVQHVSVKEITDMKRPGNTTDNTRSPSLWLPQQLMTTRLDLPTLLRYKHKKQLSSYTAQLHTLQLLQLSQYTMTTVEKEMLPVLQQMDVDHPSYLALYRAVYALLCTNGQRFPVMVQDIPEVDTQSEDINDF